MGQMIKREPLTSALAKHRPLQALALAFCLAACTSTAVTTDDTSTTPVEELPTTSAPVLASPHVVAEVPELRMSTRTESANGDIVHSFATYPQFDDLADFSRSVEEDVLAQILSFSEPYSDTGGDGLTVPEIAIEYELVVASGSVLGVRLLTTEFSGANVAYSVRYHYLDIAASGQLSAVELIKSDPDQFASFESLVSDALAERGLPAFDLAEAAADAYDAIGFTDAGDLLVEFDEGEVGPGSDGRISIVLSGDNVEPLLSDFGQRVRSEVVSPSGPIVVEQPTTSSTSTDGEPSTTTEGDTTSSTTTPPSDTTQVGDPTNPAPGDPVDCAVVACVALTFDDGPSRYTPELLDILSQYGAKATFFVVGSNAERSGDTLQAIALAGHEIGNHTFDHPDLTKRSQEDVFNQLDLTSNAIEAVTGNRPTIMRPPYGATNATVASYGLAQILWSVDPQDWKNRDTAVVAQRIIDATGAGDIVLLHDIYASSVDAVPIVLESFKSQGFVLVTVSTLLGSDLAPGQTYSHG